MHNLHIQPHKKLINYKGKSSHILVVKPGQYHGSEGIKANVTLSTADSLENTSHYSQSNSIYLFIIYLFIFIRYFLYIHFKCYPESSLSSFFYYVFSSITFPMLSQKSPTTCHPLPYPPIPIFWPWRSPVLGHIKFAIPRGLSSK